MRRKFKNADEAYNYFLSVIFPHDEMQILDYNRIIKDLNGLKEDEFFESLKKSFIITPLKKRLSPIEKGNFSMLLNSNSYNLKIKNQIKSNDQVEKLDASILQNHLLKPILGINNPRTDSRIDFVGGIRGLKELEKRCDDDFQKTMRIVNTLGWDTDCNAGNLGCLMGIKNGLDGINNGPDWRGPVADKLYLPTADGGRSISDAASEAIYLANTGRQFHSLSPEFPKNGARFHFELPDSVQGFDSEDTLECRGTASISNIIGYSTLGTRCLAIQFNSLANGRSARVETPTFSTSAEISKYFSNRGYSLLASPTIYPGQNISARLVADESNLKPILTSLYIKHFNKFDELSLMSSEKIMLEPGKDCQFTWKVPDTYCYPIAFVGVELEGKGGETGKVYLDFLDWEGEAKVLLNRPEERKVTKLNRDKGPIMWKTAWVDGLDGDDNLTLMDFWPEPYRLIQNVGRGLLIQGTRQWKNYKVSVRMTPHMCEAGGIGIRVQGMTRYYALLLKENETHLIRSHE